MLTTHTSNEDSAGRQQKVGRGALGVLFLAVFVDLLGFGIVIPLLPFWTLSLGADVLTYGLLVSSYSLMQFLFAPLWGRVSDRKGRRPVILFGLTGTMIGFGILVIAASFVESLFMLFASRIISGVFTAATLPTSQAYIADSTSGEDRAKGFGLIGAAFGLGFALGPAIGGILSIWGYIYPALFATLLAMVNLLLAIRNLPETLTVEVRKQRQEFRERFGERTPFAVLGEIAGSPVILILVVLFAVVSLGMANMESTLALFGEERGFLDSFTTGVLFLVVGVVAIITQGGLIRPLSSKYKDAPLISAGLFVMAIGFLAISFSTNLLLISLAVVPLAFGSSIATPTAGSLLSKVSPPENSGEILGVNQSLASLMRIIGPIMGTLLFEGFGEEFPYYVGAGLLLIAFVLSLKVAQMVEKPVYFVPCANCGIQLREGTANCKTCGFRIKQDLESGSEEPMTVL